MNKSYEIKRTTEKVNGIIIRDVINIGDHISFPIADIPQILEDIKKALEIKS